MSNDIVQWRYCISAIAANAPVSTTFFDDAKREEKRSLFFARMRLNSKVRNLKQSIKNLFKGN